ncbi:EAL domain-containing protein [Terasakiella sp. SH-1]|uniref:EAL domain-containing protein n=1 Tax=Terasakiella sp. SH-1 TaxID=2560057 RepID=UPI00107454DD|nr:EAL domain-containing protein [Terasakiella sp. SH-1]
MTETVTYRGAQDQLLGQDYWALLETMLKEAVHNNPNGVVLLRFEGLGGGGEAAPRLTGIVKGEAKQVLRTGDLIVSFDETSFLLIADQAYEQTSLELAQKLMKALGPHLSGPWARVTVSCSVVVGTAQNAIVIEKTRVPEVTGQQQKIPDLDESAKLLGKASFDYLPIWHVRRNFVMCFECIPRWHQDDGTILDENDLSQHFQKHEMEYALDAQTVFHAVDQVVKVIEHNNMASILVPIHFDTVMEDAGFEMFLQTYGTLLPAWRNRVSMELKSIPENAGSDDIKRALHRLRSYCYGLYLQVPFGFDKIGDYGVDGIVSFGVDLSHDNRDEAEILSDMEVFIAKVSQYENLHAHALGLKTVSLSVGAICAGFDFIGCQPIDQELEGWGLDDFLIKPVDLYKQFLKHK